MPDIDPPKPIDCWNRIGVWAKEGRSCPELEKNFHCRNCLVYIRAGRQKLNQPVPDDYDMAWIETWLTKKNNVTLFQQQRLLIFRLGDDYFSLPLIQIREVLALKEPTQLPHTNHTVLRGLTHVRGEVCLYISLCGLLSMAQVSIHGDIEGKRLIYTSVAEQAMVFAVESIYGIITYHDDDLQPLPDSLHAQQRQLSKGMIVVDIHNHAHHVCVLDTTRWDSIMERLR